MSARDDREFMKKALRLALRGEGCTSPNPMVGAVCVLGGEIVGRGYHKKAGAAHAEIEAFADAERKGISLKGATLYVTLEPCCHTEKLTPPCTDAIIASGVSDVVVGAIDPNPKVSGKGVAKLRENGIAVRTGVLERECTETNEFFNKHVVSGLPFVILKCASTIDGKIASATGDSKWIGSLKQREMAHRLRKKVDAVIVGINTVLADDPGLDVRLVGGTVRQPVPVIMDSKLSISPEARVFSTHPRSIIATTEAAESVKEKKLRELGAEILRLESDATGRVPAAELLRELGAMGMCGVLVEGGSRVGACFLREGMVDKVVFFYAPKIVGGDGVSMVGDLGKQSIEDAISIKNIKVRRFGDEVMIEGYI